MPNDEHLALLKHVDSWNQWRKNNLELHPDLSEANLYGADLNGANLSRANLSKANLGKADLYRADLYKADLTGADLSGARNFTKARIEWAIIDEKTLFPVDFKASMQPEAKQKEEQSQE